MFKSLYWISLQDGINSASVTPENQNSLLKLQQTASSDLKSQQYTPPTHNLTNAVFSKRVKSPRRLLLAKRALLAKEKQDDILSQRKSASHRYKPAACQCFGKPQICSLCSARFVDHLLLLYCR